MLQRGHRTSAERYYLIGCVDHDEKTCNTFYLIIKSDIRNATTKWKVREAQKLVMWYEVARYNVDFFPHWRCIEDVLEYALEEIWRVLLHAIIASYHDDNRLFGTSFVSKSSLDLKLRVALKRTFHIEVKKMLRVSCIRIYFSFESVLIATVKSEHYNLSSGISCSIRSESSWF